MNPARCPDRRQARGQKIATQARAKLLIIDLPFAENSSG
jgi:hypothetical protein